jgi:hypothetical protein
MTKKWGLSQAEAQWLFVSPVLQKGRVAVQEKAK